jgi:oxalate decarboxylase/phosphoglucose isomerase-like protein (cupin superfamily)
MKTRNTAKIHAEFEPICATRSAQFAIMELSPGGKSDDELSNEHPQSEQWVYVLAGSGRATVVSKKQARRSIPLRAGTLLVIEKGERHQIRNTGKSQLRTLNVYCPPAYDSAGNLR